MTDDLRLFLIVLTDNATDKLAGRGWLDDALEPKQFQNIRLYRLNDEEDPQNWRIALPFADNRGALLLRRDEDDYDYFVCLGVYPYPIRSAKQAAFCHELPDDVECRVLDSDQINYGNFLKDAIDCDDVVNSVSQKEAWDPAPGAEGAKWRAYLDMFEGVMDNKRFGVPMHKIVHKGTMAAVSLSLNADDEQGEEIADKISQARGEEVRFAFQEADGQEPPSKAPLGKLKEFNKSKGVVHVELDRKYSDSLSAHIMGGSFFPGDPNAGQAQPGGGAPAIIKFADLPADTPQCGFYYDEEQSVLAFSCRAQKGVAPADDGEGEVEVKDAGLNDWVVDPKTIDVQRMMLFADFFGDRFQINMMQRGLRQIAGMDIWDVLSGDRIAKSPHPVNVDWSGNRRRRLNEQQKEAVEKALGAPELCLIWGPPGTGKTEVIMEIARQGASPLRGEKTLIVSQANLAVDNALARLHGCADVWPLRITKDDYELEKEDESTVPVQKTIGEFFSRRLQTRLRKSKFTDNSADDKLRGEFAKHLEKSAKSLRHPREMPQMAKLYHRRINVVGATLIETGKEIKEGMSWKNKIHDTTGIAKFDTVIVDEVSKATPPELFLPALRGGRLVLVGDHKQLPPMLKLFSGDYLSEKEWAEKVGVPPEKLDIESTLFERLWERHSKLPVPQSQRPAAKLTMQYRMHKQIQGLVEQFYTDGEGTLECGLKPEQMAKMAVAESGIFSNHAVWVDTANDAVEQRDGTSFVNNNEAGIVRKLLAALPGGKNLSVGVITFYGAQLDKLRRECEDEFSEKFPGKLIFGTVDRFQGRECDVVICSLVRKNKHGTIGFAQKANRINVAFSRARRLLCIVGNSGQFCFGAGSDDARSAYKEIYVRCKKANEKDVSAAIVPAGVDVLAAKWGVNVKK